MKAKWHIVRLNNFYGQFRDELATMVEEGHIHQSFVNLSRIENSLSQLIAEIERSEFVKEK